MEVQTFDDMLDVIRSQHKKLSGNDIPEWVIEDNIDVLKEQFSDYISGDCVAIYNEETNTITFEDKK